jgi:cytochrome c oxidase subunit 2
MARPRPKRVLLRALAPAVAALLVVGAPAFAGLILPESGADSPQADNTRDLYIVILVLGLIVFALVEGVLIWCMVKFRARKGRVAAQIHGNTRLEIGWTVGAVVLVLVIAVTTFVMLPSIKNPAPSLVDANGNQVGSNAAFAATDQKAPPKGASMNIKIDGKQYVWQFTYPSIGGKSSVFSFTDLYVPEGMTITLDIQSDDVQHSWWIPKLGGKADALPGYTNHTWFRAKAGTYHGQCAELCGRNHANMYATVHVLPFDEWKAWYDREADDLATAKKDAAAERARLEKEQGATATESTGGGTNSTTTNDSE